MSSKEVFEWLWLLENRSKIGTKLSELSNLDDLDPWYRRILETGDFRLVHKRSRPTKQSRIIITTNQNKSE